MLSNPVTVDVYGDKMPLNQICSNWRSRNPACNAFKSEDNNNTKSAEKAIRDSGLGLNPQARRHIDPRPRPELSTRRHAELQK